MIFTSHAKRFMSALPLASAMVFAIGAHAQMSARPEVDLAVTYAASYSNHTTGSDFWLQGGGIDLHARLYRGLGIVASGTGLQVQNTTPLVAPLDLVTIVFGPRYTYRRRGGRVSLFGEALAGEALGFHSVFATGSGPVNTGSNGTTDSANALALQTGGGVDLKLAHRLSLRALQVDYLRTQLPNGSTNVQNNLRLGAGLVYRFTR